MEAAQVSGFVLANGPIQASSGEPALFRGHRLEYGDLLWACSSGSMRALWGGKLNKQARLAWLGKRSVLRLDGFARRTGGEIQPASRLEILRRDVFSGLRRGAMHIKALRASVHRPNRVHTSPSDKDLVTDWPFLPLCSPRCDAHHHRRTLPLLRSSVGGSPTGATGTRALPNARDARGGGCLQQACWLLSKAECRMTFGISSRAAGLLFSSRVRA
jgi:hypothetical protein